MSTVCALLERESDPAKAPEAIASQHYVLTIGAREGEGYVGMAGTRPIRVRWITPGRRLNLDAADVMLTYSGTPLVVRMTRPARGR